MKSLNNFLLGPFEITESKDFAKLSCDFNPIHNDKDFAIANGLDGTIAHGMYIMAMIGRLSTNWVDQRQIHFFGVKFKAMAKLGQTLTCKGVVKRKKDEGRLVTISVEAVDQNGEVKAGGDLIIKC